MGDRGNIFITANEKTLSEEKGIYFYTHWSGSYLKETLQNALAKEWRWTDEPYLARIIFCEMVKGQEMSETGFGISLEMPDNDYGNDIVNVLTDSQTVKIADDSWTFQEFISTTFD